MHSDWLVDIASVYMCAYIRLSVYVYTSSCVENTSTNFFSSITYYCFFSLYDDFLFIYFTAKLFKLDALVEAVTCMQISFIYNYYIVICD